MKKSLLATAFAVWAAVSPLSSQRPLFDVASVKESATGVDGGWGFSPGRVIFTGVPLRRIIAAAFEVELPAARWKFDSRKAARQVLDAAFDIQAKGSGDTKAMLRSLLAERFGLRTHLEVREVPLYALTVARPGRLGPGLRASQHNCTESFKRGIAGLHPDAPTPCKLGDLVIRYGAPLQRHAGSIGELILKVQAYLDRPLVDRTGLQGNFEWEVAFGPPDRPAPEVPTLASAFEDQLGLKVEPLTGPYEQIVIDEVHMPTPN